ncbi:MAG: sugar phosphate isomerase/epimerase [Planctomycetes bacterium]|nr:sugar phosphate isomerase/epimerase [Planctomycetota bacterium]
MKFAVNLLLWTVTLPKEKLPLLPKVKRMGYEGVEVPLFDLACIDVPATKAMLEKTGLEFLGCSIVAPEANPISEDAAVRKAAVQYLRDRIELTAKFGGKAIAGPMYSPVGKLVGRRRTPDEWKWCVQVLKEVAKCAEDRGVTLALEPINRFETYFLNTAADAVKLCRDIGSPNVKIHLDTFHANIEEKCLVGAIKTCGKYLGHFHVSENDRGIPGTGHTDWGGAFKALKSIGYDGWLAVESFGQTIKEIAAAAAIWRDLAPSADAIARDGLKFMKKTVK